MAIKKVKVLELQGLKDIAIQYYGSIEGISDILKLNKGLTFSSTLDAGMELFINTSNVLVIENVEFFAKRQSKPVSGANLFVPPTPNIFDNTFTKEFN